MILKFNLNKEALKLAGSILIVGCAVLIMLPGLIGYLAGLWRLGVLICVILLSAWGLSVLLTRLAIAKQGKRD